MCNSIIARGGYGPDPLLLILFLVVAALIGGLMIAVGKAASGRKTEPKTKREADKNTANDFARGLVIVVIVAYLAYAVVKLLVWVSEKLL